MKVVILGSGNIGATAGRLWAEAGHEVLFGFSRREGNLRRLAASVGRGARTGTPAEAASFGEAVLFFPPWVLPAVGRGRGGGLGGRGAGLVRGQGRDRHD